MTKRNDIKRHYEGNLTLRCGISQHYSKLEKILF